MDLKLPKLGEGADTGTVVNILVKEGDVIKVGQTIIELENEKAVAPIPATAAGTVAKIRVKDGDKISVGTTILTLTGGAAAASSVASPVAAPATVSAPRAAAVAPASFVAEPAPEVEFAPAASAFPPAASPTVRKVARELGLDLTRVRGSEPGGRIVMGDLRAYVQRLLALAAQPKPAPVAAVAVAPSAPVPESIDFSKWGPVEKKPLTSLRKTISRRMVENWNTIPHVTQFDEADVTALMDLRKKYLAAYEKKGARLTLTTFLLKAVAATLKKFPIFNASLDEATQEIVYKNYVHVGIAVDTDAGLIVPVIRDVDKKSLLQLSKDLSDVAAKARDRKVGLEDLKGGTFTISNQGGIGGAHFTPIVNKPEVAILGLGRSVLKPVVREKKIEARLLMPIGLSYDHRVIDGGTAARFTVELLAAIEQFKDADAKL